MSLILTEEVEENQQIRVLLVQVQPLMPSREVEARNRVIRIRTKTNLKKKIDQSLQCELLKMNVGIVVRHATWLQAAKLQKKDKNEHEAHIVQDALIPSMDSNAKL